MNFAAPRTSHVSRALCGACGAGFDMTVAQDLPAHLLACPLCRTEVVRAGLRRIRRRVPRTRVAEAGTVDPAARRIMVGNVLAVCAAVVALACGLAALIEHGPGGAPPFGEEREAEPTGIESPR